MAGDEAISLFPQQKQSAGVRRPRGWQHGELHREADDLLSVLERVTKNLLQEPVAPWRVEGYTNPDKIPTD